MGVDGLGDGSSMILRGGAAVTKRAIGVQLAVVACALAALVRGQSLPAWTPISRQAIATLTIPGFPDFLAPDGTAVWVTNEGRIEKFTAEREQPLASVPTIDPETNRVTAQFGPPAGSGGVRIGGGMVWVSAHDTNTLWALRP